MNKIPLYSLLSLLVIFTGCSLIPESKQSNEPTNKEIQKNEIISSQGCIDAGGKILSDPGDGSVYETGCGPNRIQLGIPEGYEGSLCCLEK